VLLFVVRDREERAMGDRVVHFEVNGPDGQDLADFYTELVGWELKPIPEATYWLVDTRGGAGINGGIGGTTEQHADAYSTFYVGSDDPEALMERAVDLGATVELPVTETPIVTYGLFRDPDGMIVGLVFTPELPEDTQVGPTEGDGTPVDWFEVIGKDARTTQRFYGDLFGWTLQEGFQDYAMTDTNESGIGGGLGAGGGQTWVTAYARVPDVAATMARANELGGTTVYGPNELSDGPTTGAFRDPAGNVFGVYARREA
jgi:predicted enzyme related to lactoylglutathione lyase